MVFMLEEELGGRRAKCDLREINFLQVLKHCVAAPFLLRAHFKPLVGVPQSNETDQRWL